MALFGAGSSFRSSFRIFSSFKFNRAMKISIFLGTIFGLLFFAHSMWGADAAKKKPKGPKVTEQVGTVLV